jgi:tetratricopeptide (TPR) repeat protein
MPTDSVVLSQVGASRCANKERHAIRLPATLSILLFALVLGVFSPALRNDFVNYDDPDYVTANPRVQQGLTLENIGWAFQTNHAANWHPVTWLSHMLDCTLYGQTPAGHHFTSIFSHALTTSLVFLLFWKMTGATGRSFVLAAIFGLHPLRVESVAWICERKDVLAAFFGVLTLWFYVLWNLTALSRQVPEARSKRVRAIYYGAALICFALGLMSKSMLVTLPFVMLLLDYWPLGRVRDQKSAVRSRRSVVRGLVAEKIPFLALAAATGAITLIVQARVGAVKTINVYPIAARVGNAFISYPRYLGKFFVPVNLAPFYPHPVYWPLVSIVAGACLLVALTIATVVVRRTYPWLFVGWFWFLGTAVPVIGLIQVGAQSMADRYTYIPSIGATIILVWGFCDLTKESSWQKPVLASMSIIALIASAGLTQRQIGFWRDSESLFRHTIAVTGKNPVAHMNLGIALLDRHQSSEGLRELKSAVELAPYYGEAHLTLGTAFEKTGDYESAIDELDEAIRLNPKASKPYFEAGVVFEKMGHAPQAADLFRKAIEREPGFAAAHGNLGVALEQTGQIDPAIAEYSEALRLDPNYFDGHQNLGALYFKVDRTGEARIQFERAVKLKPESAIAHNNLAGALFLLGRVEQAISEYQQALKLNPNYPEAQANLNAALRTKQR